jgi:hypothetical protein
VRKREKRYQQRKVKNEENGNGEEYKGIKERINEFDYNKNTQGLFTI